MAVTRGRPKQFDPDTALDHAMEFFWRVGYEAARLPDLLTAMGISRQSLYDTFGNKRELYIRSLEHYRATQLSAGLALLDSGGSPLENVRNLVAFFEELAADSRCRGCFVANALVEMGARDAEITKLLQEILEQLRVAVATTLRQAQQRGELTDNKSADHLSRALTNAMVGMAVTGKLEIGREELNQIYAGTLSMLD